MLCEMDVAEMGCTKVPGWILAVAIGLCYSSMVHAQPPSDPWVTPSRAIVAEAPRATAAEAAFTVPRPLPARDAAESPAQSSRNSGLPQAASLWGTVAALLVIAAGVLVSAKWIRRNGPAVLRVLPNEAVEPLGQRVLSRGVAVHLVRCGGQMLLLGVGPDGVRTLASINDPEEIEMLSAACQRRDESALKLPSFSQLLNRQTAAVTTPTPSRTSLPLDNFVGRSVGSLTEVDGV